MKERHKTKDAKKASSRIEQRYTRDRSAIAAEVAVEDAHEDRHASEAGLRPVDEWQSALIEDTKVALSHDEYWRGRLESEDWAVHLAVFVEPYLQFLLDGKKTVESRFSVNRCAPYGRVRPGDTVILKKAGGGIVGVCTIAAVWSYTMDPASWIEVRTRFARALCAQSTEFWDSRRHAAFATLMKVDKVTEIGRSVDCQKRDRRGWVVVRDRYEALPLPGMNL